MRVLVCGRALAARRDRARVGEQTAHFLMDELFGALDARRPRAKMQTYPMSGETSTSRFFHHT